MEILRNWVVAATAPGVAGENSFQSKPASLEGAIFANSLQSVVGTGRRITTGTANPWGKRPLIELDHPYHYG